MDRGVKDGLRAGATAVCVAAGLFALASTAQTPDGFVHASFGGPLDVFGKTTTSDVLSIGDGASDATELAALLQAPGVVTGSTPNQPLRVTVQAGEASGATTVSVFPTVAPNIAATIAATPDDPAAPPSRPAVDASGRVDCAGSLSCKTDPVTKATTVTYPDGVVAVVQKVDDLTVVAYRRVGGSLRSQVQALQPPPPDTSPAVAPTLDTPPPDTAAPILVPTPPEPTTDPSQALLVAPAPELPDEQPTVPEIELGPDPVTLGPAVDPRGPRVNVTRPPLDLGPGNLPDPNHRAPVKPTIPGLGKVKEAVGSVVDAVKDGLGKAVNPGASGKAKGSGKAGNPGSSGTHDAESESP